MISSHEQGRLKVVNHSMSTLEMIHSWAKQDNLIRSDPSLYIDLTIVWFQVDQNKVIPSMWNEETLRLITQEWMKIPANFMMDETVRLYSFRMLASLLNMFWRTKMDIHTIRSFQKVIQKAAADIESYMMAGFLKYAVVKISNEPRIITINGSNRKIVDLFYACSVIIVRRSKATSEDIENFYAAKNSNGAIDHLEACEEVKPDEPDKVSVFRRIF